MKKNNMYLLMTFALGMFFLPLEGVSNDPHGIHSGYSQEEQDEYDILERNAIDDTDTLAIPFDDSEVEDEEEINRLERHDTFHLPHSH